LYKDEGINVGIEPTRRRNSRNSVPIIDCGKKNGGENIQTNVMRV
jgi:hypothetical protein